MLSECTLFMDLNYKNQIYHFHHQLQKVPTLQKGILVEVFLIVIFWSMSLVQLIMLHWIWNKNLLDLNSWSVPLCCLGEVINVIWTSRVWIYSFLPPIWKWFWLLW